jgi:hypothetical protein
VTRDGHGHRRHAVTVTAGHGHESLCSESAGPGRARPRPSVTVTGTVRDSESAFSSPNAGPGRPGPATEPGHCRSRPGDAGTGGAAAPQHSLFKGTGRLALRVSLSDHDRGTPVSRPAGVSTVTAAAAATDPVAGPPGRRRRGGPEPRACHYDAAWDLPGSGHGPAGRVIIA